MKRIRARGEKKFRCSLSIRPFLNSFQNGCDHVCRTIHLSGEILVINGIVVFHLLTFIVWAIIFTKDLVFEPKRPIDDNKKAK